MASFDDKLSLQPIGCLPKIGFKTGPMYTYRRWKSPLLVSINICGLAFGSIFEHR